MLKITNFLNINNALVSYSLSRLFSTTSINNNMKNFNKFTLIWRGTEYEKKKLKEYPARLEVEREHGVRHPGYWAGNKFVVIPEAIPDIIVPDLTNCQFKPYVSYRTPDISQGEFTAEDLFNEIYSEKIENDFKQNKLNAEGNSLEPSEEEKLTCTEAFNNARKVGSDLFSQDRPYPTREELLNLD